MSCRRYLSAITIDKNHYGGRRQTINPAIKLENINKKLKTREILKDISLAVEQGDIFGYLGPNGAGKTTTIRVILGLFKPDSGEAYIFGQGVGRDDAREKVGFVLEADGLYDNLTAHENLGYYCQIYGVSQVQAKGRIEQLLGLVELSDRAGDKVSSYSKGMRQKLALARSMVHEPDLLIFDEPTAAVDPTGQMEIRQIILNLAQRGKTVFLSSHNLDEVQRICNRIALIDEGEIKLYGELEKLRREMGKREVVIETGITTAEEAKSLGGLVSELEALPYVTSCNREARKLHLKLDGRADVSEIVAVLSQKGIGIEEIRKEEVTLEEIYAKVVKGEK